LRALLRALLIVLVSAVFAACRGDRAPAPRRVFVSNELAGTISVIDPATRTLVATIPVGKRPRGLRVSRDGWTLYVALSGSPRAAPGTDESTLPPPDRAADGIGVVDLERLALVRVLPSGQDPESFDLAGDDVLVVSNEETSEASIIDVDGRKIRAQLFVGGEPEGVTTAPDGTVWVTSEANGLVSAIDVGKRVVAAIVNAGERPRSIAFARDGRGLVANENDASLTILDNRTRSATGRIALPRDKAMPRPMGVAFARDDRYAYVTTGRAGSVAVVDPVAASVVAMIDGVGARPWGIAVAHDGFIYTANGPSNDISVIDPVTRAVVQRIVTGGSPWGVAVSP
jgi:YVTN family beta-propeller protein